MNGWTREKERRKNKHGSDVTVIVAGDAAAIAEVVAVGTHDAAAVGHAAHKVDLGCIRDCGEHETRAAEHTGVEKSHSVLFFLFFFQTAHRLFLFHPSK